MVVTYVAYGSDALPPTPKSIPLPSYTLIFMNNTVLLVYDGVRSSRRAD